MLYILEGKPVGIVKAREAHYRRQWDVQSEARSKFCVELTMQHADLPLFDGPLYMRAVFYFPYPQFVCEGKLEASSGKPHTSNPSLSDLIQFFEWLGKGIVFSSHYIISSVEAKKCYDARPRAEIIIERVEASWKK